MTAHASHSTMRLVADIGFFVLFPGFFLYHLGVTSGWFTNFAGGLFGPSTVLLTSIYLLCGWRFIKNSGTASLGLTFIFLLLLFYASAWIFIQHLSLARPYLNEASAQAVGLLFAWFALFCVGLGARIRASLFVFLLWVSFSIILLSTALLFNNDRMIFNPRAYFNVEEGVATYQGYARSALLTSLLLLGATKKFSVRLGIFSVSLIMLFVLGARSELFGFAAIASLFLAIESAKSSKTLIAYVFFVLFVAVFVGSHLDDLMDSRQLEVLDLSDSTSWAGRTHYLNIAIIQIFDNPFLGIYGGHFEAGGAGAYAHNIISSWVEFGLIGFLMYGLLCSYCFAVSFLRFMKGGDLAFTWGSAFLVNGVSLLLVFISKPVFWSVPALGWGLVVGALRAERLVDKRKTP